VIFLKKLKGCTDRHAPIKKLNSKEIQLRSKPWIEPELSKMIRIKNNLYARTKRQPMNNNIKLLYNRFRNRVNRETKKSKTNYYTQYFDTHNKNIKKVWQGIRS